MIPCAYHHFFTYSFIFSYFFFSYPPSLPFSSLLAVARNQSQGCHRFSGAPLFWLIKLSLRSEQVVSRIQLCKSHMTNQVTSECRLIDTRS